MNNKKKDNNFNPYPGLGGIPNDTTFNSWGIPSDTRPSDTPVNNFFGVGPNIPTSNIYSRVNVEQVSGLFSSALRFQMPSSVRLITIHGSEVFIPNDVFELTNISLILSIKGQLEDGIFKRENSDILDIVYMPQNGLTSDGCYVSYYTTPNTDVIAVNTMTQAATRLITIFKDLGIDLTSDIATMTTGARLRDIFMSAYVITLQIVIMYNVKREHMKAEKLRNMTPPMSDAHKLNKNDLLHSANIDKIFGMPAEETSFENEHKKLFDGIKPDENGMFNIEFGKDSDKLTEIIDKASDYESNNKKEVKKDE